MSAGRCAPLLAAALCLACHSPAATPLTPPLLPDIGFAPILPDEADRAVAELAAAALASDPVEATRAIERIDAVDAGRLAEGREPTGLAAPAADVLHATLFRGRAYREATAKLLERDDVPPGMRTRLERALHDDPLVLANARIHDARMVSVARVFNSVAEPLGKAIFSLAMLPYHVARSLVGLVVKMADDEPLTLRRRQALAHWKEFLARYPDAEQSDEVAREVTYAQQRWEQTRHQRAVARAEDALDSGNPRRALVYAERALSHDPGDDDTLDLRDEAVRHVRAREERLRWSLQAEESIRVALPPGSRELALAMLSPEGDVEAALASLPELHPLVPEARYALAAVKGERGDDTDMLADLHTLADKGKGGRMARHARAALADPVRNPYDAFTTLRARDTTVLTLWILFGPAIQLPKGGISGFAKWLVSLPGRLQSISALPLRLLQAPWGRPLPSAADTAVQARRYLTLHPNGRHGEEVRDWLEDYERDRQNWLGALRVASERPLPQPREIESLREKAAGQALDVASREERRDMRNAMLHNVTREFSDTHAGREAGRMAREEALNLRPHQIRISRGFLEENPIVAGPEGLGLDPSLLDGDNSNGELHPDGVTLVGGREIELSFVEPGGDKDEEPEHLTAQVSEERLARLVARLEEQSFQNALTDEDEAIEPDAQRDLLFERARLGLTDTIDPRANAEARYAYRGVREKYGMVRSRESILPFDLVLQGSLEDLSLAAFPRMRTPKETPDAVLYE